MFTGAQALREPFNRNVFHVRASYFDETERIVQHLTTLGTKKIAVFYQNDAYGKAGLEGVERALAKRQLKLVGAATHRAQYASTWPKAVETLIPAGAEAIVQVSAYKSCAAFIKQARAKGFGGQFFNVSFVGSKALADELGDEGKGVVISQVVPFPFIAKCSGGSRIPGEDEARPAKRNSTSPAWRATSPPAFSPKGSSAPAATSHAIA